MDACGSLIAERAEKIEGFGLLKRDVEDNADFSQKLYLRLQFVVFIGLSV